MEKSKKKSIKSIVSWCCIAALVLGLALMPLLAAESAQEDGPQAVTNSAQVEQGTVSQALRFGGSLASQDGEELTLPSGVRIKSFLVKNGDTVRKGDALAQVDSVTVMEAITQVQDTLDYLDSQLNSLDSASGTTRLTAQTSGMVKEVYAQKGDDVQQVMVEHGALMVLSLDGKMAVDIVTEESMPVGYTLTITLATGETVQGRVDSRLGNTYIITIADKGYAPDTQAEVSTQEGKQLGTGNLYIHNPWRVTAVSGKVSSVKGKENQKVSQGELLLSLTDTDTDAQQQTLLDQRQDYEDTMQTLFQLYETGTLNAPCDGVVDGVDTDSPLLLAGQEGQWEIVLLSAIQEEGEINEPEPSEPEPSEPEPSQPNPSDPKPTGYEGIVAVIRAGENGGLTYLTNNVTLTISDPSELTQAQKDVASLTTPVSFAGDSYLYVLSQGTLRLTATQAAAGQLVFITDGKLISLGTVSTGTGTLPEGSIPGDLSGLLSGALAGMGGMGGMTMAPSFEPYDLTETTVLTVTPEDTLTLEVPVDELDISKVTLGMEAQVRVTALGSQTYTARVTKIGAAVNSGGNSKFTVTLTLNKEENMLPGMSASAVLSLGQGEAGLTIPTAAIYDDDEGIFVYTALEEKTGALAKPVPVTLGESDGETTRILSGLEEGQTVYYTTYEVSQNP